jgi:hypothetical protein
LSNLSVRLVAKGGSKGTKRRYSPEELISKLREAMLLLRQGKIVVEAIALDIRFYDQWLTSITKKAIVRGHLPKTFEAVNPYFPS